MKEKIKYKFFTKNKGLSKGIYESLNCGLNSKDDPKKVLSNIKIAANFLTKIKKRIIIPNQSHSNKCLIVSSKISDYDCDALVTNRQDFILGVTTADCLPIMFYDPKELIFGLCHAGWRGLLSGIIQNTVQKMIKMGSINKNINTIIGPCIRKKSYEVSEKFIDELSPKYRVFSSIMNDKYYYDLPQLAKYILINNNILKIHDTKKNTYLSKDYFSYRESKKNKFNDYGRNINMISIN